MSTAVIDEVEEALLAPSGYVYQIRTPGAHEWLELDREAYERVRDVRGFDRRVLVVIDESIVG